MANSTERCAPSGVSKWKFKPQWSTIHMPTRLTNIKDRTSSQCWRSFGKVGSLMCCCGTVKWYSHSGIKCLTERMEWKDCEHSHKRSAWRLFCDLTISTPLSCLWWLCIDLATLPQGTVDIAEFSSLPTPFCFFLLLLFFSFSLLSFISKTRVFLCSLSWAWIHHSPASSSCVLG